MSGVRVFHRPFAPSHFLKSHASVRSSAETALESSDNDSSSSRGRHRAEAGDSLIQFLHDIPNGLRARLQYLRKMVVGKILRSDVAVAVGVDGIGVGRNDCPMRLIKGLGMVNGIKEIDV